MSEPGVHLGPAVLPIHPKKPSSAEAEWAAEVLTGEALEHTRLFLSGLHLQRFVSMAAVC